MLPDLASTVPGNIRSKLETFEKCASELSGTVTDSVMFRSSSSGARLVLLFGIRNPDDAGAVDSGG